MPVTVKFQDFWGNYFGSLMKILIASLNIDVPEVSVCLYDLLKKLKGW